MRKFIAITVTLLFCIVLFVGCDDTSNLEESSITDINSLEGVTMIISEDAESNTWHLLTIHNDSTKELDIPYAYAIERKVENTWYQLPVKRWNDKPYNWTYGPYPLSPGETLEASINWSDVYGKLKPGEYRVVKSIYVMGEILIESEGYYIAVEFSIE